MLGLQQLNKLPPSSDLRLRRVCVLAARSGCKATRLCCQPPSHTTASPSPPSSPWGWARTAHGLCAHTHTHAHSAVARPTVLCNETKAARRPRGPRRCGPSTVQTKLDLPFSKAHAGRRAREGLSHPTGCNHCPCTSGPLPRLPPLLSFTPAPSQRGASAGGVCRAITATLSGCSPSLGMTQGLVQREQQCLGALCPACRDQAALRNDKPGLSPAERGLRHQPELHVGWERHRQGGSPRPQTSRRRMAAAPPRLGPTELPASWQFSTQTAFPHTPGPFEAGRAQVQTSPAPSLPAASPLMRGKRERSWSKQEPIYSAL